MQEIWKDIKNYEELYQVSNYGRVKSLQRYVKTCNNSNRTVREKILKLTKDNTDYYVVSLWRENKQSRPHIHRLVAETFIPNPDNLPCVNHIDGNQLNNTVTNLEWCDYSYNAIHAIKIGLNKHCKKVNQYTLQGTFIKTWNNIKEAQEFYKTSHISACCRNNRKSTKGYIWKYADK